MNMRRGTLLRWKRWPLDVIERAYAKMSAGDQYAARRAVSHQGWVDINGENGRKLAEVCERECPPTEVM